MSIGPTIQEGIRLIYMKLLSFYKRLTNNKIGIVQLKYLPRLFFIHVNTHNLYIIYTLKQE